MSQAGPTGDPSSLDVHEVVQSPEQVALALPLAGPTSRILAYAIDFILLGFAQMAIAIAMILSGYALGEVLGGLLGDEIEQIEPGDPSSVRPLLMIMMGLYLAVQFVSELVYFVLCELAMNGQSIGKRIVGLRVVGEHGLGVGLRGSLARNLLRFVDMLPVQYMVGLTAMVISERGQRIGDLAANTLVIRLDQPLAAADVDGAVSDASPYRFSREQLEAVGPVELQLMRQTLRRVYGLRPSEADPLVARAASVLRERLDYEEVPPEEQRAFLEALLAAATR